MAIDNPVLMDSPQTAPAVRTLKQSDLRDALMKGWEDFKSVPTHAIFITIIYPILGLLLFRATFHFNLIPLLFPIIAGFALLGPFAAVGLYEISRLRERGQPVTWRNAVALLGSRSIGSILVLGGALMALFVAWLGAAQLIYAQFFGDLVPTSLTGLLSQIFASPEGIGLLIVGNLVGLVFALVAFAISVVSFPMLIDRNVSVPIAVITSIQAIKKNPIVMLQWGLLVTAALVAGSLPLLVGLAVVMPVLGHATWHLYRKLVA